MENGTEDYLWSSKSKSFSMSIKPQSTLNLLSFACSLYASNLKYIFHYTVSSVVFLSWSYKVAKALLLRLKSKNKMKFYF